MRASFKSWHKSGEPYIWLNAGAVTVSMLMVIGLLLVIAMRGLEHFWPKAIAEFEYQDAADKITIIGEHAGTEVVPAERFDRQVLDLLEEDEHIVSRYLYKIGNRDAFGFDFKWVAEPLMDEIHYPDDLVAVERREWGNMYGYLAGIKKNGQTVSDHDSLWREAQQHIDEATGIFEKIRRIEKVDIGEINYEIERIRLKKRELQLDGVTDKSLYQALDDRHVGLEKAYQALAKELNELNTDLARGGLVMQLSDGREVEVPLARVVRAYRPNAMGLLDKTGFYLAKLWEFVSDEPREANTEGGIFPAIFGTVLMVMLMAVLVTPFGVVAAVYLREYATQGPLTRAIRIAVNNLAGVPSVVYGVFGLGFFVYVIGGSIDELFFRAGLPQPTFGTPGLLWASLTLAILTVPVVIVSTEEGLTRVPRSIREGSLALGATKAETLWRTVLPMTGSAMMTGLILAVARAAGEVAPLMLVGVVKLAPSLPLDGNYPYLHLDRKFMHLGFHIYDVGFQSPNVEAARPLVYATSLLLVLIIIVLNLTAIRIRNRLREKYRAAEQN